MDAAANSEKQLPDLDEEMREKKQVAEVDQLGRLPDEVVVVIVNKLLNLKTLLRFSAVAKRYSSLVSQTDSLVTHVSVPSSPAVGFVDRMWGFLKNLLLPNLVTRNRNRNRANINPEAEAEAEAEVDAWQKKFSAITTRFQQIKNLRINLYGDKDKPYCSSSGVFSSWFALFGSHLEVSLFLVAASVSHTNTNTNTTNTNTNTPAAAAAFVVSGFLDHWLEIFKTISRTSWAKHVIIAAVASKCKMIETAVFSDTSVGGALLMGKQQLAKLRGKRSASASSSAPAELRVVVYHVPTLDLPRNGCTLNDVLLFSAMPSAHQDAGNNIVELIKGGSESDFEKWEVFAEAAGLILNDHQNRRETMYDFLHPYQQLVSYS